MDDGNQIDIRVSRSQIVVRGLTNRCPNCGMRSLFRSGLTLNPSCPHCLLTFERGEGFFLGAMPINYGVTLIFCLTPILLLRFFGFLSGWTAAVLAVLGALGFPVLFYRSSRSWWLMFYYFFLPHELPANSSEIEENP